MAWLVVGLGNPGRKYEGHRHNIGFMVVDELSRRWGGSFTEKFHGLSGKVRVRNEEVLLLEPQTFMNRSGVSVGRAAAFHKIDPAHVVVIHDELDLPFLKLRVKVGGGHGGHNGLRSIFEHFGKEFVRVRCGIGRPERGDPADYVLSDFSGSERAEVAQVIDAGADAVELIVTEGAERAMNTYNGLEIGA